MLHFVGEDEVTRVVKEDRDLGGGCARGGVFIDGYITACHTRSYAVINVRALAHHMAPFIDTDAKVSMLSKSSRPEQPR